MHESRIQIPVVVLQLLRPLPSLGQSATLKLSFQLWDKKTQQMWYFSVFFHWKKCVWASNAAFSELVNLHVFLYFQLYSVFLLFYCICPVPFCHRADCFCYCTERWVVREISVSQWSCKACIAEDAEHRNNMSIKELLLAKNWLGCLPEAIGILRMLSDWVLRYE